MKKNFRMKRSLLALMLAVLLAVPLLSVPVQAASKPSAPAVTKVVNVSSGVTVTWKKVSSASGYYVYRKTGSGSYSKIATIKKNSTVTYTDKKASAGKTYTYAVKAYNSKGTSGYGTAKTIKRLTQPAVKVANTSSGIKVSWGKITGASKYRIYYKKDGKWTKLTDTTSTSYTDKSVKSGSSRTYTVKALSGSYGSSYMSGKTLKRLSQPAPSLSNTASGVKISWGKVTGAEKYRVYYKKDGKWTKLADTTSTSYTDKNVKSGSSRTYTVKAISGSSSSSYVSGKTLTYIGQPVVSISTTAEGLKVSWNKVNGAAKYRVFQKNTDGKWEKLADTASTSYTDKTVKNGVSYTYTIRCITSDGKSYTSSYDTKGVTATYKHTHNYTSKVTKAATCNESGIRTSTCPCGDSYTEVIPALGHDWEDLTEKQWVVDGKVWVVDKEAYDEQVEVGYEEYYECNNCGARFEDSADAGDHLAECPEYVGNGYSYVYKPIYETVHHDEEGHYEETGHYETVVTGRKCSRCGLEETK